MIVLDISVIIAALPKIHDALHFSSTGLSWVQNAYTLTFGGLLLLGARAGDMLGRRRMLVGGIALFTAASLAGGLAPSAEWLLAARAVQGVGAAIAAPVHARAAHDDVSRRARERTRAHRVLQRRRRRRRQRRPRARRRADRLALVALGAVHQRARRPRGDPARAALPARDGAAPGALRPHGSRHVDARHDRARLRLRARRLRRLERSRARSRRSPPPPCCSPPSCVTETRAEQPITPLHLFAEPPALRRLRRARPRHRRHVLDVLLPDAVPAGRAAATARCRPASRSCR